MQEFGLVAGLALAAVALFLFAWGAARRQRRLGAAAPGVAPEAEGPAGGSVGGSAAGTPASGPDPLLRRLERRMEEVEAAQARVAERIAAMAEEGGPARLQAMAGSLLALVRDKNATLETALAGMDGLRARIATLEGIGDLAEARALVEGLAARLDALEAAQARAAVHAEAQAEAHAEVRAAIRAEMREEVRAALAARAEEGGAGPLAELGEALARLHAQKEAAAEVVIARLGPVEAKLAALEARVAGLDPEPALARLDERTDGRLAALGERIAGLEATARVEGEAPRTAERAAERAAEALERMAVLGAARETALATLMDRLGPVEARLAEVEAAAADWAGAGPAAREGIARLDGDVAALEARLEGEVAALGARLDRADDGLEAVFGRLAALEASLGELDGRMGDLAPRAAVERLDTRIDLVRQRLAALEETEPLEAVAARLEPVEAALGALGDRVREMDPTAALDRFAERLEAAREALQGQIDDLRPEGPLAEVSEQLTRLYAQKDATVEAVLPGGGTEAARQGAEDFAGIWQHPRVVSLHQTS